ncbi:MAG: TonB-dependent receptor [Bacteroidales bacterium]|jgi:iron complex outermembrane receptor protein|nr:TonB-dependent receptor [Bacteroidales bacterium]
MKRFFSLFIILFLAVSVRAQFTINGFVKNTDKEPLIGANVFIKKISKGESTNINGKYSFSDIPKGEYVISVTYMGYKNKNKKIIISNDLNIDFLLELESIFADEVIVQAIRASEKTPMAFSSMNKKSLEGIEKTQDIPYLLNMLPSVVQTSEAGTGVGYTNLRIRGTDPTRINVTVNSIPLNDAESQGVYWVNMPDFVSSVDNIQVQRGVGTSTNGAGAFGGSINFKTESINEDAYAEINSVGGSFNTYKHNVKIGTGLIDDNFSFDARFSKVNTDGYIDHAFSDHRSFFLSGTYYSEKSLIKTNIIRGEQRTGITWWGVPDNKIENDRTYNPAGQYVDMYGNKKYYEDQTDNYIQTHYQMLFSHEVSNSLNMNIALHYTKGDGYYEQYKEDEDFADYNLAPIMLSDTLLNIGDRTIVFPDSTISSSDIIRQKIMDNDFYGFTYSMNYVKEKIDMSIGGAWNKYDGDHFGKVLWSEFTSNNEKDYKWYNNNGLKTDYNIYTKINYKPVNGLNVYGDIQYRGINYIMTGIDDNLENLEQEHNYNFINPKAGIYYDFNKTVSSYLSFSIANREPTRSDLKNAVRDNSAIPKSETLYDFELGTNLKYANAIFKANLYYMLYDNQLVSTGEKSNVGYDIKTNVDESYRAGIELIGGIKFSEKINWNFNLTFSQNKIKNFVEYADYYDANWNDLGHLSKKLGETDISYSPNLIGASNIQISPIKNCKVNFISKYVGKQYFDNTSSDQRMLDAYFVNNLNINYSIDTKIAKKVSFNLAVNNIFDLKYISNAYGGNWYENAPVSGNYLNAEEKTWAYYFPQARINFLAGISILF